MRGRLDYSSPLKVVAPYILTAADNGSGGEPGWGNAVIGPLYGAPFGSMTETPIVIGGKTIGGILWDFPFMLVWLQENGASWSTGRSIWVNGVEYPFTSGTDYSTYSYHAFNGSNIFTAGLTYTIAFS